MRAVWGRGGYTAPRSPHHSCSTPPRAQAPGTCSGASSGASRARGRPRAERANPYPLSSDPDLASIAVGYPIGSTNVEPRKGYETLQSIHGTELKHPNQGENVRECFVNSLDPFGATLTSFTFGAPKALPRGARLRSREKEKLPPRQSIVAPKEVQRGLLSGGCGLEAEEAVRRANRPRR